MGQSGVSVISVGRRLHEYLFSLSREQLVSRLLALAERDEIALTALRVEAAAFSGDFDLAAFRKELTARLRISGFVDRRGAAGYAQRVHGLLDVFHFAACVAARPEPKRLAVRLVELALKSDWEWFRDAPQRYADVLGEDGLAAYRATLEREWGALPALPPSESPIFGRFDTRRFTVTRLRESLARAGGNVDELVSVLAKDL